MSRADRREHLQVRTEFAPEPMTANQMTLAWDLAIARKVARQARRAAAIRNTVTTAK